MSICYHIYIGSLFLTNWWLSSIIANQRSSSSPSPNHHLWVELVEIFKTEICLLPLRICQPAVWNHHYLATSCPGDEHYDDNYDYDNNGVDHDLPAATPSGASSKTRQSSGFSPSSPAATWSIITIVRSSLTVQS